MKNYIIWLYHQYEGWHVLSTHETKAEALRTIRLALTLGNNPDDIHLTSDLNWSVNVDGTTHTYNRGNWEG